MVVVARVGSAVDDDLERVTNDLGELEFAAALLLVVRSTRISAKRTGRVRIGDPVGHRLPPGSRVGLVDPSLLVVVQRVAVLVDRHCRRGQVVADDLEPARAGANLRVHHARGAIEVAHRVHVGLVVRPGVCLVVEREPARPPPQRVDEAFVRALQHRKRLVRIAGPVVHPEVRRVLVVTTTRTRAGLRAEGRRRRSRPLNGGATLGKSAGADGEGEED